MTNKKILNKNVGQVVAQTTVTNATNITSGPAVINTNNAYIYKQPTAGISRYDFNTGKKISKNYSRN